MPSKPFKRGATWYVVVELDRAADGQRRQKWVRGATQKEALAAATALQHARNTRTAPEPTKQTVAAYVAEWLDTERHRLEATSAANYGYIVAKHIAGHFATLRMDQLAPAHVAKWLAYLRAKELSSSRLVSTWSVLHAALDAAVKLGTLPYNPCDRVTPPRRARVERQIWDEDRARAFLARIAADKYHALYALVMGTGLRRGEILGLRWQDVDLARGVLTVRQAQARVNGRPLIFKPPKTPGSRRAITLPAFAVAALKAHKARQNAERLRFGAVWEETDLVFCKPGGAALPPGTFEYSWYKLRAALVADGFPYIRLHDLRHLHATLGLAAGVHPKVMSERLGHSSVTITLDLYSHVTETMQARGERSGS